METPEAEVEEESALDVLASIEPVVEAEEADEANHVLAALDVIEEVEKEDDPADILAGLEAVAEEPEEETAADVLAGIEIAEETIEADLSLDVLTGLEAPEAEVEDDNTLVVLGNIEPVPEAEDADDAGDILAGLDAVEAPALDEGSIDILAGIEPVDDIEPDDDAADILAGIEAVPEESEEDLAADVLAGIEVSEDAPQQDEAADVLAALDAIEEPAETDTTGDVLSGLDAPEPVEEDDTLDDVFASLDEIEEPGIEDDPNDILATLEPDKTIDNDDAAELDDLLGALESTAVQDGDIEEAEAEEVGSDGGSTDALDDLLADLEEEEITLAPEPDGLADLLEETDADTDAEDMLDSLFADAEDEPAETPEDVAPEDDLDALLGDLDDSAESELDNLLSETDAPEPEEASAASADDDLDDLLGELTVEDPPEGEDDLDALLAGFDDDTAIGDDDLDDLGGDQPTDTAEPIGAGQATQTASEFSYGQISADRPSPQKLERKRFRIAILGDFTGRAARGQIEVGAALAERPAIPLDTDTVEQVIESFATTLVLPIGKEGAGVKVDLRGLDDLHPDELYENVEVFAALRDLKSQLSTGGTAQSAAASLIEWGETYGRAVTPARATSGSNTVRADLKLSDFQKLVGDTANRLAQPSAVDDLLARIVGPHIRKLPDPDATAMASAVDDALSGAMRLVLHHPDFQSIEAQWRSLDLIARSIETDDTLEVMLYDISAEEIAADLTQADDLSQSGLVRLLTEEPMDEVTGRGAYSALMGLYTFEETPPHAQLLGRIARVAAHVDAPFFTAITPGFIDTPKKDRHPLVAQEWDTLRAMPEAAHLALASPRFMLRRPYGAKSEPIYAFEFEEFTQSAGLSGMLWANPVVLVAILLARSFKEIGPSMGLGQIMSLGDVPYHFVTDNYGEQVALPCTERNLTLDKIETVLGRGFLPVISIKGRDEIRLGSFQSLAGGDILGPWAGVAPPPPSPPKPPRAATAEDTPYVPDADADLDDLLAGFDLDADDASDSDTDDDMDEELAALLADL
ncbi:putative cytoplasmic protein [Sulfitobacter noctilucae]|nr:putative cytoplasmic protein [Sulfitobacter noctilucae]